MSYVYTPGEADVTKPSRFHIGRVRTKIKIKVAVVVY